MVTLTPWSRRRSTRSWRRRSQSGRPSSPPSSRAPGEGSRPAGPRPRAGSRGGAGRLPAADGDGRPGRRPRPPGVGRHVRLRGGGAPPARADGIDVEAYYVASAELFDRLSEADREQIFPEQKAQLAMGITDSRGPRSTGGSDPIWGAPSVSTLPARAFPRERLRPRRRRRGRAGRGQPAPRHRPLRRGARRPT